MISGLMLLIHVMYGQSTDTVLIITGRGEVTGNQKILDLSHQGLVKLPARAVNPAIEVLILDNNNLSELPVWIGELKNLRILSLRNNNFRILTDVIRNCENLEQLYLSGNRELVDISAINTSQKIELIDVVDTKINKELPWIRMMNRLYYFKFTARKPEVK